MIENKKLIKDISSVQKFKTVLSIYIKILMPFVIAILIFAYVAIRSLNNKSNFYEPFLSTLLIIVVSSGIIIISYALYILITEKRNNWIILLFVMVIIPFVFAYLIFQQFLFYKMFGAVLPVLLYYIYCFLLKSEVERWLTEYYGHQNRLEQKRLKEEEAERLKNGLF